MIKQLIITIVFLIVNIIHAQPPNSNIKVSEAEIISLIKLLKEKQAQIIKDNNLDDKAIADSLNKTETTSFKPVAKEANDLYLKLDNKTKKNSKSQSNRIVNQITDQKISTNSVTSTTENSQRDSLYSLSLYQQIDSLIFQIKLIDSANSQKLNNLQIKIDQLSKKIHHFKQESLPEQNESTKGEETPSKIIINEPVTEIVKTIDINSLKTQVYFENNSATIEEKYKNSLTSLIEFLQSNTDLSIELHGNASQTGSKLYNQKLSKKRANAVKAHIVSNGISSRRIKVYYHGSSNNKVVEAARNVTIKFIEN